MAAIETSNRSATGTDAAPAADGVLALLNSLQNCTSRTDAWRRSLQCIASYLNSPFALLQIDSATTHFSEQVSAGDEATRAWKRHCDGMLLAARHSGASRARLFQASGNTRTYAVLSAPVPDDSGSFVGALALVIDCQSNAVADARLSELTSLLRAAAVFGTPRDADASKVNSINPSAVSTPDRRVSANSAAALSKLGGCQSLHEFAFSLVNDLKGKIGADQVSMGIVHGNSPTILCTSGFDNLYPRSPGSRMIEQAMAECMDAGEIVCWQKEGQWSQDIAHTGHHLHRHWHESSGGVPVASIPLMQADQCIAVLSIRRPADKAFELAHLQKVASVVSTYAPALRLLEHANRSVLRHAVDSLSRAANRFLSGGSLRRPVILALSAALLGWFFLRDTDHVISVPCEIVPARELQLAAPFNGCIAESCVQPGEKVHANQLLLRMDTRSLHMEYEAARTQLEIAQLELARNAAADKLAETALADAQIRVAENTMATIRFNLDRAEIKAPADGYILAGELNHRVGEAVPMGEPLLRFAASDEWLVELHVPEHSATHLSKDMQGAFAVDARPDETCDFSLEHLEISAGVVNGQNVFVAKGRIDGTVSPWMRSGMQGTAKVIAGRQPAWWVWFHRAVDAVRLQVWKW
ncbi:MAG: efflux RND transporter periplasmic adaptor subunit [Planctomycetaceae bacterium]